MPEESKEGVVVIESTLTEITDNGVELRVLAEGEKEYEILLDHIELHVSL